MNQNLKEMFPFFSGVFSLSAESNIDGWEGGSAAVHCKYELQKYRDHVKYWCKGYPWQSCHILKKSNSPQETHSRVTIHDDKKKGIFTVILSELKREDNGRYACGIEISGVTLDEGLCYVGFGVSVFVIMWEIPDFSLMMISFKPYTVCIQSGCVLCGQTFKEQCSFLSTPYKINLFNPKMPFLESFSVAN
uniref:Immunoglobulin V-set domain-containing protein n=1 Tax=Erpetoichthys calabaricus TaxID=27687 RepID=A0A8C4SH70_ERPCA